MLKSPIMKAIVAALVAGAGALAAAAQDGSLNLPDAVSSLISLVAAFGATWAVPNKGQVKE